MLTANRTGRILPAKVNTGVYSFQEKDLGCVIGGDGPKWPIPSLLPSQNPYFKSYIFLAFTLSGRDVE